MRKLALLSLLVAVCAHADAPPLADNRAFADRNGTQLDFDHFIDAWLANAHLLVSHDCVVGNTTKTCLFVPWFGDSSHCGEANLNGGCMSPTTPTFTNFCVVTDELSQVGLVLAMRGDPRFPQWVNTIRRILRADPKVPLWRFRVDISGPTAIIDFGGIDDDASDATARIVLALYIATSSSTFASNAAEYRVLADEISRGFLSDFIDQPTAIRNPITSQDETIRYWLASGQNTARRNTAFCTNCEGAFSYAGYHGDVVIALMAAKRGAFSNNGTYETMAIDTARHYLRASAFANAGFRVPPVSYSLELSGDTLAAHCVNCDSCNGTTSWDWSDAVRAVSICKAGYHAAAAGVALPSELADYCNAWVTKGFVSGSYARRYRIDGDYCELGAGYEELSLASYIRFQYGATAYTDYLGRAINQFDSAKTPTCFGSSNDANFCAGIYFPAFVAVSFGSAIGRDHAFERPSVASLALTATPNDAGGVDVAWSDVAAASFTVERSADGGASWPDSWSGLTQHALTTSASADAVYLYRVKALDAGNNVIGTSNQDLVTTFALAPVHRGDVVRAQHINDLADAINAVRAIASLAPVAGVAAGQLVKAGDIQTLRAGLEEARAHFSLPPVSYRQLPVVAHVNIIHAWEVNELREGLR